MKNAIILSMLAALGLSAEFCWKGSKTRGAGSPISTCGGLEKSGLICYDACKEGYKGVGPVCWQQCDSGYHDDGAFCRKNAHIYGKGCCTIFNHCKNKCPSDYKEDPCTCRKDAHIYAKKTYGRGAGKPMGCAPGTELSGAICYRPCEKGYKGVGPVCWGACPPNWHDCGAGCAPTAKQCGDKIIKMITETGSAIANTVSKAIGDDNKSETAQNVKKVADKIKENAGFATKVGDYVAKILISAKEKGTPMTEEEAQQTAEETIGQLADGVDTDNEDEWDKIMNKVAEVDPTGLMAAAKVFKNPLCHTLH